jgi:HEAT repeat protein
MTGFTDSDAAVRYWAAYGCAILEKKAMPAKGALTSLLDDPAPEVSIVASQALYYLGASTPALDGLKTALDNDNAEVRLEALNVIRALGQGALPLLPKLQNMLLHLNMRVEGANQHEHYEPRLIEYIVIQLTERIGQGI